MKKLVCRTVLTAIGTTVGDRCICNRSSIRCSCNILQARNIQCTLDPPDRSQLVETLRVLSEQQSLSKTF
ncbi:MAG: hypothetical protein HXS48_23610 [Theionarchaea archaeon]|nr:hypothetical protein [Theionarchaea archaeon]